MEQSKDPASIDLSDLIIQELKYHPMGEKVLDLIQNHGIEAKDSTALARIVSEVSETDSDTDPRIILMLSMLLEIMVKYSEELSSKQLKNQQQKGKSKGNNFSGTSS